MIVNQNSTTETISRKVLKGTVELRATAELITSSLSHLTWSLMFIDNLNLICRGLNLHHFFEE